MNSNLAKIRADLEDVKTFHDDSYLKTSHFVVFLLFGFNEEQKNIMSSRANTIIAERKAYALIKVEECADIVRSVEDVIERASEDHVPVDDFNEIHVCPVIISHAAEVERYASVVKSVDKYLNNRTIRSEWKPFLILDTLASNAAAWLDAVAGTVQELGTHKSCRCCLMTRKDEENKGVSEERLLTTVLFVAFLNVTNNTRNDIGHHIAYKETAPDELFYTAQTAFIENPVKTRILKRMAWLLRRLIKDIPVRTEIDMSFMQKILKSHFEKLPRENGKISLLPLFSVMPGENMEFKKRLDDFAHKYYLSFSMSWENEKRLFRTIAAQFLRAHITSGRSGDDLMALIGNEEELSRLSIVQATISISSLPEYPLKGKAGGRVSEIYSDCAQSLSRELIYIGKKLLQKFFESEEFTRLPKKYTAVQERLSEEISNIEHEIRLRSAFDVNVPLLNDPDEKWIDEKYKDSETVDAYIKSFCDMALAEGVQVFDTKLATLYDWLYQLTKGLSGSAGAKAYMDLVSETCADTNGHEAKSCMASIKGGLKFPINRVTGSDSYTFVWGNEDNNLFRVWKAHHRMICTDYTPLPLKSNERFVVLRVSDGFSRQDILRLRGGGMH